MTSLREWFRDFTESTGEMPDSVVLGWKNGWGDYHQEDWPTTPTGVVAFSDLTDDVLDQDFDSGYGGNESPNLCAWSPGYVLFSDNYDGAESLCWVPRHPVAHEPIRPGGG